MVRLETPSKDVHPYGKGLAPGEHMKQIRVNAYMQLSWTKERFMRHPPMLVYVWLRARLWPVGPEGSAA